jgi:pyridinium-3,5-bisthiocarboxylic acid mononucleotide nickel chelatase
MRIGYLDCFSGASGDMIVGSIVGAGCAPEYLQSQLDLLGIPSVRLVAGTTKKQGLSGVTVRFETAETNPPHRHLSAIERIISESGLDEAVKSSAIAIFRRIGAAESRMHDLPIEKIHFHEVGAIDAICDIVCALAGFKKLGVDRLYSSAILLGSGVIKSAHGMIPLPAPATLEIVKGFPVRHIDIGREMTTPTGAAIIRELAEYSPAYEMMVESTGYGAGTMDLDDRPNLLRLIVGTVDAGLDVDQVMIIETNIDDATPEQIGHLQQRLLESGALDVFVTSILMKKNRPGHLLSVICHHDKVESLSVIVLRESSTAGVRLRTESRRKLSYQIRPAETEFGTIRIKFFSGGDISKFSPEYEDVVAAALKAGAPFLKVYNSAIMAATQLKENQSE